MKILTTFITIAVLAVQATAQAQHKGMRADIDKDIPLVDAVKRANEQFPDIQPLTEEEVIAAVQAIKLQHPDIKEPVYEIYQRVAKERILPRGMYFSHIPAWHTQYGHFQVDWKDLTLTPLPVGTKDEKIGYGFNYRIRARFISSRPLTESEASEMKHRAKMVEPGAPADGSQPLGPEANRTSGAAAPRRSGRTLGRYAQRKSLHTDYTCSACHQRPHVASGAYWDELGSRRRVLSAHPWHGMGHGPQSDLSERGND